MKEYSVLNEPYVISLEPEETNFFLELAHGADFISVEPEEINFFLRRAYDDSEPVEGFLEDDSESVREFLGDDDSSGPEPDEDFPEFGENTISTEKKKEDLESAQGALEDDDNIDPDL